MRFNFEAEPKSSRYSYTPISIRLHVFTNPVVRHDFGAPLKHKSRTDSWILLRPDERERRCKLILYPGWRQRVEVASVSVHRCTHDCGLRVACNSLSPAKRDAHWGRSTTNPSDLQI